LPEGNGDQKKQHDAAANIANDTQENLPALEVVSVGSIFADEIDGDLYLQVYVALSTRATDDFVEHFITLAHVQDTLPAQIIPCPAPRVHRCLARSPNALVSRSCIRFSKGQPC
jgi:hypothetical protein